MSSYDRPPSSQGTVKKTDTLATMEEPTKSVPGIMDDVTRVVDHKAERRLCRKFDYRLLPILAVMCEYTCPQALHNVPSYLASSKADSYQIYLMLWIRETWEMQRPMECLVVSYHQFNESWKIH
jgi:hypothetical protein